LCMSEVGGEPQKEGTEELYPQMPVPVQVHSALPLVRQHRTCRECLQRMESGRALVSGDKLSLRLKVRSPGLAE
jgi:hypothetical protein